MTQRSLRPQSGVEPGPFRLPSLATQSEFNPSQSNMFNSTRVQSKFNRNVEFNHSSIRDSPFNQSRPELSFSKLNPSSISGPSEFNPRYCVQSDLQDHHPVDIPKTNVQDHPVAMYHPIQMSTMATIDPGAWDNYLEPTLSRAIRVRAVCLNLGRG